MRANQQSGIGMTSQRTRERLAQRLKSEGIQNPQILDLITTTPRHLFVDEAISHRAYEDTALPIGMGQTISQPFIVARMTELLIETGAMDRVLEIGTGSGYQTAVLSKVFKEVYTIERINGLQKFAQQRFRNLKLFNITCRHGDGLKGWPEKAPFDAIIVTAAPEHIPSQLMEQLKEGGRMIVPVGPQGGLQKLTLLQKLDSKMTEILLDDVKFVPLISGVVD